MKVNFHAILHSHAPPPPFLEIMILPCSPCCFLTLDFGPERPPGGRAVQGYDQQVVLVLFLLREPQHMFCRTALHKRGFCNLATVGN